MRAFGTRKENAQDCGDPPRWGGPGKAPWALRGAQQTSKPVATKPNRAQKGGKAAEDAAAKVETRKRPARPLARSSGMLKARLQEEGKNEDVSAHGRRFQPAPPGPQHASHLRVGSHAAPPPRRLSARLAAQSLQGPQALAPKPAVSQSGKENAEQRARARRIPPAPAPLKSYMGATAGSQAVSQRRLSSRLAAQAPHPPRFAAPQPGVRAGKENKDPNLQAMYLGLAPAGPEDSKPAAFAGEALRPRRMSARLAGQPFQARQFATRVPGVQEGAQEEKPAWQGVRFEPAAPVVSGIGSQAVPRRMSTRLAAHPLQPRQPFAQIRAHALQPTVPPTVPTLPTAEREPKPVHCKVKVPGQPVRAVDLGVKVRQGSKPHRQSQAFTREDLFSPNEPKTRAQKAAAMRESGMSMSMLLRNRSEKATGRRSSLTGQKRSSMQEDPPMSPVAVPCSPAPDIDKKDRSNPLSCTEYVKDIYDYYMRIEDTLRAAPTYMDTIQNDVNAKMRGILIDWLVDVHLNFKLMPETLFLTVNLVDRYLEKVQVSRKKLQLVGVTALLIASKYEEVWPPEVRDYISICDRAYTRQEILQMEKAMLKEVAWRLTVPTTYDFLARFLKAADCYSEKQIALCSSYLGELALVSYKMLKYKFSEIAAAAVYVSRRATNCEDPYPYALKKHSTFCVEDLMPCIRDLVQLMETAGSGQTKAVYRKYSNRKFQSAAKIPAPRL